MTKATLIDARQAALAYLDRGLAPIPLPRRSKAPSSETGWQNLRIVARDIDQFFRAGVVANVGILTGAASANLIDVDLDAPEAVAVAPILLPSTGWVFGRASNPRSHWLYRVESSAATTTFRDKQAAGAAQMLVELRGDNCQTVFPPSLHKETGERIEWHRFDKPAAVALDDLDSAVREIAAASLLARYWPGKGSRQDAFLALAGGLIRAGWAEERIGKFVEAIAVATGDDEARMRVNTVARTERKQAGDSKTTGWPTLQKLIRNGKAVVEQVRDWLRIDSTPATAVEAFTPTAPVWPNPPGAEAYHGLAGDIVRIIDPASEADPVALLVQLLVMFGNVVGRGPHFIVEADRHYTNEFLVLVGQSGKGRKGTSRNRIASLLKPADTPWDENRNVSGLSSGEGLIWSVRDPISKQEKVKDKTGIRYETVEADPGETDKRLMIVEPEFANVLKQTERQGNTVSAILRQAWESGNLRSLTKNNPARATDAHISMIGHITDDELRRYLSATETANGFANRIIWVAVRRSKLLPRGGAVDPVILADLQGRLVEAVAFARSVDVVARDSEADGLWDGLYATLSSDRPGLAGALLGRSEAHVMRLAMLYALLDRSPLIGCDHLLAAAALWDYVERSVAYIFGDSLGDPLADDLLRLLRAAPDGLTRTDINSYLGRNSPAGRINQALGKLLQFNLARFEREESGGRPVERWFAIQKGKS